jgi:hypothetical protein
MQYEVAKDGARLWITVEDGKATKAESPTHGCFDANFLGRTWESVRASFERQGFTVTEGS